MIIPHFQPLGTINIPFVGDISATLICDSKSIFDVGCDFIATPPASLASPLTISVDALRAIANPIGEFNKVKDTIIAWANTIKLPGK